MAIVYVQNIDGKPLMPTTRCGHVRILLKQEKAKVVETTPFTIRLCYETPDETQPLSNGTVFNRNKLTDSVAEAMVRNGEAENSADMIICEEKAWVNVFRNGRKL